MHWYNFYLKVSKSYHTLKGIYPDHYTLIQIFLFTQSFSLLLRVNVYPSPAMESAVGNPPWHVEWVPWNRWRRVEKYQTEETERMASLILDLFAIYIYVNGIYGLIYIDLTWPNHKHVFARYLRFSEIQECNQQDISRNVDTKGML
jgi:hypothetical protein